MVKLTKEEHRAVKLLAARLDRTMQQLGREAIRALLAKHGEPIVEGSSQEVNPDTE